MKRAFIFLAALVALGASFQSAARAAQVWTGSLITFTQPAGVDPTLPANQDRLTGNVWITRAITEGLYNAKTESAYTHFSSPAGTEWAVGSLANYASLTYGTWEGLFGGSAGGGPTSLVGQQTVLHLLADDIYLSVVLTAWAMHGGGFTYQRSTPAQITPPTPPRLNCLTLPSGGLRVFFTNAPGLNFKMTATTNVSQLTTNWTVLGTVTDAPAGSGQYQFIDVGVTANLTHRFYQVRWP